MIADDDVLEAWAGFMFKAGLAPKPPLLPPDPDGNRRGGRDRSRGHRARRCTSALSTGTGQHIDLAIQTAAAAATDWSYSNASVMREAGRPYNEVRAGGGFMYPIFACRDGFVRMVILSPRQWQSLWQWMGEPPEFADEFWTQVGNRIMNADVLNMAYGEFFADKAMIDICVEGQNRGIVVTPAAPTRRGPRRHAPRCPGHVHHRRDRSRYRRAHGLGLLGDRRYAPRLHEPGTRAR